MELNKQLLTGSFILLVGFGLFSFFNLLFHFFMARMLSLSDYGVLVVLFSIIYMLLIFGESMQTVIVKYTTSNKDAGKLKNFLKKSLKKAWSFSLIIFVCYILLAIPASIILKINYSLFVISGLIIFTIFFLSVTRGAMQGRKKFTSLSISMILEGILKIGISILLVYIGLRVYGALIGAIIGALIALGVSFIPLKNIFSSKESPSDNVGLIDYAKPTFVITLIIMAFYSIDVIIAKIVFVDTLAGSYAIASTLSKIIFWGTQPISKAMFPLSSENYVNGKKSQNIFNSSLAVLIFGACLALVILYFFSNFIVWIFSGKEVLSSSSILFYLGFGMSLVSIANLVLLYKLSLSKTKGYLKLWFILLLEALLLFYFSSNLIVFSIAFICASAALLWGSIFLIKD